MHKSLIFYYEIGTGMENTRGCGFTASSFVRDDFEGFAESFAALGIEINYLSPTLSPTLSPRQGIMSKKK